MPQPTCEGLEHKLMAAICRADAAERKAEAAMEEASTAQRHIQAIFNKIRRGYLLLLLPQATVQLMLKDIPDRSKIFAEQVRGFEQERGNLAWASDRHMCLGNLVILSQLPPDGVSLAVTQATRWASQELQLYYDSSSMKKLVELDRVLLAAFCTLESQEWNNEISDLQLHIEPLLHARQVNSLVFKRHLERHMRELGYPRKFKGVRQRLSEGAALLFLKKVWFPQTLKFLRGIRRKKVTGFLMPMIAKDKLPVELMDTIAGFYYGAEFMARAATVAKQTAAKYSSSGCNAGARALRW